MIKKTLAGMLRFGGPAVLALVATVSAAQQQQLPFDPSMIDQLSPEQQQRAREVLGQGGSSAFSANSQGRFTDQTLPQPQVVRPGGARAYDDVLAGDCAGLGVSNDGSNDARQDSGDNAARYDYRSDASRGACRDRQRDLQSLDGDAGYGESRKLRPFGYDLFFGSPSTFAPVTEIPVPSEYVLGPGDNLRVQLFGNENANYSLLISRDGRINFPKLGPIDVAGLRFDDVKALIEDRVSREMIGVQASVTLGQLRSMRVFLLGDVNHPGSYLVSSLSTITNALFVGGGVNLVGSLRNIQLKRAGRVVQTLDLYDLLLHGDSSADLRLQPGDVVFVPPVGARVSVDGEVRRPAIYELRGEKSVDQILKMAGGVLASTNTSTAQIERYDRNQKRTLRQINLDRSVDLAMAVQDGDLVRVRKVAGPLDNNVRVVGAVKYPGNLEWSQGLLLSQVLASAQVTPSDLHREVYLPLGLIERTNPVSGVRDWMSFNLQATLAGTTAPLPMQRDDLVVVLTRKDVAYLYSTEVQEVASGDFSHVSTCPALKELQSLMNSERSIRFARAFSSESLHIEEEKRRKAEKLAEAGVLSGNDAQKSAGGGGLSQTSANAQSRNLDARSLQELEAYRREQMAARIRECPTVFRKLPRALPYLLEESVAVYGEVRRPGLYPVAPGTPADLLVDAAGGLTNESDPKNVEYVSYEEALKRGDSRYQVLSFASAATTSLTVSPGDVFNFKPIYIGQEVGKVKVAGAFRFPGSYGILRGEHLSELMKRAGGITSDAYPYGAIFTRESARKAEEDSYRRAASDLQEAIVTAITSGALKDAANAGPFLNTVVQKLQTAEPIGRVVTESDPAVLEAKPELDPVLEPGDAVFMPKRPISVTIIGQVLNPGTQAFSPGATLKQYVERAGGFTQAADESRVFVILPNGTAKRFQTSFWNYESEDVPPGSSIVVPRDAAPFNLLAFSERIFSVLSSLALTAAALATISHNGG
jgi:protein involved in polysaccharide export with SLBB domain